MGFLFTISLHKLRPMAFFGVAITLMSVACSFNSPEPTEERLIQRSEMANYALNTQNWAGIYQLYPPAVRDICSLEDFETGWVANYEEQFGVLLEFLGASPGLIIVVETNSVSVIGEDAYLTLELDAFAADGSPVIENLVNENAQAWKFIDGEWFIGEDIPEQFC